MTVPKRGLERGGQTEREERQVSQVHQHSHWPYFQPQEAATCVPVLGTRQQEAQENGPPSLALEAAEGFLLECSL